MGKGRRAKSGIIGTCAVEGAISVFLRRKRDVILCQPGLAQERDRHYDGALRPGGNADKRPENVGMVFQPCWAVGVRAYKAYKRRMMG